jgi:predicted dinucleotide-utilizing enzyme
LKDRGRPREIGLPLLVATEIWFSDSPEAVLIAGPTAQGDRHTVKASGAFGTIEIQLEAKNLPVSPKSSALGGDGH